MTEGSKPQAKLTVPKTSCGSHQKAAAANSVGLQIWGEPRE